jgi:hypothetical protein
VGKQYNCWVSDTIGGLAIKLVVSNKIGGLAIKMVGKQ